MTKAIIGVREAVRRGANWLDVNHLGWANRVNLSMLQMNSCSNCVIGQAVGDYYETIMLASDDTGSEEWAIDNGFCGKDYWDPETGYDMEAEKAYYLRLEELWAEEVRGRLG